MHRPPAATPPPRVRTLFQGGGLRARLGWYAPGQRMARHAHAQHQYSILLGGTLGEAAAGDDIRIAGSAIGFKATGVAHANHYGPAGALIFGVDVEASMPWPGSASGAAPWRWQTAPPESLLRQSRRLLAALVAPVDGDLEGQLWELVAEMATIAPDAMGKSPPVWLARVRDRLQEESTPLALLARSEGLHPVYLTRAFVRWTGNTPSTERARARMQRALTRVAARHSLVDAALQAGFADQAHFSRAVRAHLGLSPRQLRKLLLD